MKTRWYIRFSLILLTIIATATLRAQVIEADNPYPTVNDPVDITFHVNRCDCNLDGYNGDIYVHAGLITNQSADAGDWKFVISDWGENLEKAKLEKIDDSTHILHITPDISTYYGITEGTVVEELAFVFRSADASMQTANIYHDVYQPGLSVSITEPESSGIVTDGETISVTAAGIALGTADPDSLTLYLDDVVEHITYSSELSYDITASGSGQHWIKVVADNGEFVSADSVFFFVRNDVTIAEVPVGARDGVNINNESSVTVVIYAPGKESILLIGDFNDWELDNAYLMNQTSDGNRFWLTLDGLSADEEYAFQYLIDGHLRIADPYTEKILDPANDEYILPSVYPDLKPYPEGKTTGITSTFQTVENEYSWQTNEFVTPDITDLVIYELHVQNFTEEGSIKALTDTLNYLAELGVNVIELMPVNEFEGNLSWGYNPSFYFALDKNYGTKNDFKAFVDACHDNGIAVVIDMVLNHSYDQSPLAQMYWDAEASKPTADNPWYNANHNFVDNTSAQWGNDFNHESQATQDLVDSINSYWMTEYRIDGFRFDFTKGMSNTQWTGANNWASSYDQSRIDILTRMADEIWERNSDALVIFEHLAENSEETVLANHGILLWGNMNHQYNEATMGYSSNLSGSFYTNRGWSEPHLVSYMESHDEERLMYKNQRWGNSNDSYDARVFSTAMGRTEAAAAFFFTVPGPKMVWEWGELGYDYSINRCTDGTVDDNGHCRLALKPVGWPLYDDPHRYRMFKVYQALIDLKKNQDVFRTSSLDYDLNSAMKWIILEDATMNAVILGNFGMSENTMDVSFPASGTWYDYFSGESMEASGEAQSISLQPGEYHIYFDQELAVPDIPVIVDDISVVNELAFRIYPNPSNGTIQLETGRINEFRFELYTLTGERIIQKDLQATNGSLSFSLHSEAGIELKAGTYVYRVISGEYQQQDMLIIHE